LSGGGGATFCTGSDYYQFNYNWVCGNLSAGEGGGVVHLGFIYNGDIEHNSIMLNQSSNPTIPTNGGGIMVQGTPDTDPVCGALIDQDCPPGLSDGTGPNLVINANLIQANSADSGAGGGIRMNQVNGTDVSTFPNNCVFPGLGALAPCFFGGTPASAYWNSASITNNIIINNMAGWDGAGISLQDSLNVSIVNNTIAHNDSLASSGVLTTGIGTPQASAPAGNCTRTGPTGTANSASCPQVAGVASTRNSALLTTTFVPAPTCPPGQTPATGCRTYSNPILGNNIIWQNRAFQIGISGPGTGTLNQQNLVTLYNASPTFTGVGGAAPAQTATGQCSSSTGASPPAYWDIGVRGDTGPTNHSGGTLTPTYSVLSSGGYAAPNSSTPPPVVAQYCNGSRVPPECTVGEGCGGPKGFGVPPGINDAVTPNPVFSLTPAATVDEGNNWINVSWGPLALSNPALNAGAGFTGTGNYASGPPLANYNLTAAIDSIPVAQAHPFFDFYGNARPEPGIDPTGRFDPGAIEFGSSAGTVAATLLPPSWAAPATARGCIPFFTCPSQVFILQNTGSVELTGILQATVGGANASDFPIFGLFSTCGPSGPPNGQLVAQANLAPGASCMIEVFFEPSGADTAGAKSATLSITSAAGTKTAALTGTAQ
jgi:hypothetical protein